MKKVIEDKYGPQCSGDNVFTRKARLFQSYYRVNVLQEKHFGVGPNENSTIKIKDKKKMANGEEVPSYYGNILVNGDKTGSNFLNKDIFEYVKSRIRFLKKGETINEYRIYNNLLSSQPMCFNLFFPIKALFERDDRMATIILARCFPDLRIKQILAVEIEYLPYPVSEYLNDRTAFDAMLLYITETGERNVLVVETKYVEKLGTNPSSDLTKQIELVINSVLFNTQGKTVVSKGFSQLGRNFLLAEKFRMENRLDKAFAVVISPEKNNSSIEEINDFHLMMNPEFHDRLFYVSLETILDRINDNPPQFLINWIDDFKKRYLNFDSFESI